MTRGRMTPTLLVAPLAAGVLLVTTDWALQHRPPQPSATAAAGSPDSTAVAQPGSSPLRRQATVAAHRLAADQSRLLRLETVMRSRAVQVAQVEASLRRRTSLTVPAQVPAAGAPLPQPAPAPLPALAPAPPVQATTGAS